MANQTQHERATSNVLAWSTHGANMEPAAEEDAGADVDEPPDRATNASPNASRFQKTQVRRSTDQRESLLTKALHSPSEDESVDGSVGTTNHRRRRSMNSNTSLASTATTDTGITTPARTSSPSPRLATVITFPSVAAGPLDLLGAKKQLGYVVPKAGPAQGPPARVETTPVQPSKNTAVQTLEKKRCISFACTSKPAQPAALIAQPPARAATTPTAKTTAPEAPKRPCIKFACPARPAAQAAPKKPEEAVQKPPRRPSPAPQRSISPTTVRKVRVPPIGQQRLQPATPRRQSQSPVTVRPKKYLSAESQDLQCESSRFHEFASDEPVEDDWIRRDKSSPQRRLTIDDTLKMELAIRQLGKEAEEEAEEEEQEEEEEDDDDEAEQDGRTPKAGFPDFDEIEIAEEDDGDLDYDSDDDASDGYKTDNEVGFASSDDEDDDLVLWTMQQAGTPMVSCVGPAFRRPSVADVHSDSSSASLTKTVRRGRAKNRELPMRFRPGTPELPDSTDFVCGTLDEDRPLEDAYLSCMAARKRENLLLIPQDIDPSFPTSEPEDDDKDERVKPVAHGSDEQLWLHGELEDLHHGQERTEKRKKKSGESPKRYRSPPPKARRRSPPPPPRRLFDRYSPSAKLRSPPVAQMITSPPASPVQPCEGIPFNKSLAFRPGLTHTKSLPRAPAMFPFPKPQRRARANTTIKTGHVRGAIDIFKGLEQKRQRRKEKFLQKYCNRARKGQVHEKKPQPGEGAERMREVGLIMAGKIGQGKFVLSV